MDSEARNSDRGDRKRPRHGPAPPVAPRQTSIKLRTMLDPSKPDPITPTRIIKNVLQSEERVGWMLAVMASDTLQFQWVSTNYKPLSSNWATTRPGFSPGLFIPPPVHSALEAGTVYAGSE